MIHLTAFIPQPEVDPITAGLRSVEGIRHVRVEAATTDEPALLSVYLDPMSVDLTLEFLARFSIASGDVTIVRTSEVRLPGRGRRSSPAGDGSIWAEVGERAGSEARIAPSYLLNMAAAGVVAAVGVATGSATLIVGAMAISPDLLPIAATAVGLVDRRWNMASRAIRTLAAGLTASAIAAFGVTALLLSIHRIPHDLILADTMLGSSLTKVGPGSIAVALAAGMAGILAFARVGGAAVGVAISVTTTPAVAYVGAATALGKANPAEGALVVLVTNVVFIVAASTATLAIQRRMSRRTSAHSAA
jgi:uncharacterized hydrophobic protein (TIGR00271 family)